MTTIHIIETDEERAIVKRIFRQRMQCVSEGAMDLSYNSIHGGVSFDDNGDSGYLSGHGAIVYDIVGDGDPDLGWIVYDFRRDGKCYAVGERDTAGLMSLPSDVFPF